MPGAPPRQPDTGLVSNGEQDTSERPQADPEVPELGSWDKTRGELPDNDATGF